MVLFDLFWNFMLIGFTSFGGMSMIPQINEVMLRYGWMTTSQVTDIVAIAEMTPGPLALNCASFTGMHAAGIPGAIAANLGALSPSLTLCLVAAIFYSKFRESSTMQKILLGVRPACLGLLLGVMVTMSQTNYFGDAGIKLPTVAISCLDVFLMLKYKWSVPKILGLSAVLGLLIFGLIGL